MQHLSLLDAHDVEQRGHESTVEILAPLLISRLVGEVSRDRGQIFREAATEGAPQAKQVVDRYHLQKNFAEALEKFFRKQERVLKKATGGSTGKAPPAERLAVPEKVSQEPCSSSPTSESSLADLETVSRRISQRADCSGRRSQFAQCLSCPRTRNASTSATTISLFFHR